MEPDAPLAPPVVAVVVVHAPGPWFDETLDSLADQDYPNLNTLFLLTGGPADADGADLEARILARLPDAFVRDLGANPGYGPAANEVLRLVEGDAGFFCFCHDDIALEPDAIRLLLEELYRSNAGMVGPKLVDWDDPGVLQHVGLGMDRFGEIDPITEPSEYDQEQHDAVRDVFVLPSACLLVRADVFRVVGGFDDGIDFHGDDVDLCWRLHLSGARVLVTPQARVRHREQLEVRRPELNHPVLRARHRLRTVATLTGGRRLFTRSVELVLLTVAELAVGLFTGRFGDAWATLRALVGLVPRTPGLLSRRGAIAKIRQVPDAEVVDLQNGGSARLTSYLRSRDTETFVGEETSVKRWRESTLGTTLIWIVVLVGILVASRTFIDTRVPAVGELLPLPGSAGDLWNDFLAGWNPNGLGGTGANPTGWGLLSIVSVLWWLRMGLGLTVLVVGLVVIGVVGAWRLATVFPSNRARLTALVVYASVPLIPGVISTGRLSALVAYATVPWFVHLLRGAVGIGTADPELVGDQLVDGVMALPVRERVRRTAVLAIAT
ncbi:MAG: glycosyltransferase family 2 protein, partial [Acidimicrobiia bacterium]|nr:glycosyltransferase family 2 protein [Acidimicrobiia bacterium]